MWSFSMIYQAVSKTYEPNVTIHILMTTVAGAAFGTNFIKPKNGNGGSNG